MRKRNRYTITNIYRKNDLTNAQIVEVSLEDYDELFNGWDASLLKRKELEPELMDYLLASSREIPFNENLELEFYVPSSKKNSEKELRSLEGIKYNFKVGLHFVQQALSANTRKILTYIAISIGFLLLAYLLPTVSDLGIMFSILMEGLFIGGWVMLWEAFSLFFFASHELRVKRKHLIRLLESELSIIYQNV